MFCKIKQKQNQYSANLVKMQNLYSTVFSCIQHYSVVFNSSQQQSKVVKSFMPVSLSVQPKLFNISSANLEKLQNLYSTVVNSNQQYYPKLGVYNKTVYLSVQTPTFRVVLLSLVLNSTTLQVGVYNNTLKAGVYNKAVYLSIYTPTFRLVLFVNSTQQY